MEITQTQIDLIADIYDAAINPGRWPDLLDRCALAVGSKGTALHAVDTLDPAYFAVQEANHLWTPSMLRDYAEKYAQYDAKGLQIIAASTPGTIITDEAVWPDRATFSVRPDVVRMKKELGIFNRAGIRLSDEKAWLDLMIFQFADDRGNMTPDEADIFQFLRPHISKAIALSRGFSLLRARFNAVLSALDRFRIGLFLVMPNGTVVHRNATGAMLLAREDGVIIANGRLALGTSEYSAQLRRIIADVSSTARAEGTKTSVAFKAQKLSQRDPYLVEVSPLRDSEGEIDRSFRGALVSVIDPDDGMNVSTKGIQQLYGLTAAEAEVTNLTVLGHSMSEIAEIRSVSKETVKSQLKSIRDKTGSTNRTDLVRLAMTVNLPISEEKTI